MTASYKPAGPTLDDVHDLRGLAEIEAYREFCEELELDEWLASSFDLWTVERPEPEPEDDSKWIREGR